MSTVNVFLVDPLRLLREGIKSLLQNTPFRIGGDSGEWRDAIVALEQGAKIDLLLLELPREPENAPALLHAMHRAAPNAKIVVLTTNLESWLLAKAGDFGICGLLQKDISPVALLHSLQLVMLSEKVFPIHQTFLPMTQDHDKLMTQDHNKLPSWAEVAQVAEPRQDLADLSAREIEILRYLTKGLPNKVIGRELNVAETTVKAHIKTILRKVKAGNRTQAAVWCLANGLDSSCPGRSPGDRSKEESASDNPAFAQWYRDAKRSAKEPFAVEAVPNMGVIPDRASV